MGVASGMGAVGCGFWLGTFSSDSTAVSVVFGGFGASAPAAGPSRFSGAYGFALQSYSAMASFIQVLFNLMI